jgi:hypothetical protein
MFAAIIIISKNKTTWASPGVSGCVNDPLLQGSAGTGWARPLLNIAFEQKPLKLKVKIHPPKKIFKIDSKNLQYFVKMPPLQKSTGHLCTTKSKALDADIKFNRLTSNRLSNERFDMSNSISTNKITLLEFISPKFIESLS